MRHPVQQQQCRRHLPVLAQKRGQDRRQVHAAEGDRGGEGQMPAGGRGLAGGRLLRFVHVLQGPADGLQIEPAGFGDGHGAGGAVEQADADPVFQECDGPGDRRRGDPQLARGGGETARIGDRDEDFQRVLAVHHCSI